MARPLWGGHSRATLQGYFLPASAVTMAGYWLSGLWIPAVTHYYLLSLFVAIPATFLGRALNHRLKAEAFVKWAGRSALGFCC
jgi:uncharacterized protein